MDNLDDVLKKALDTPPLKKKNIVKKPKKKKKSRK